MIERAFAVVCGLILLAGALAFAYRLGQQDAPVQTRYRQIVDVQVIDYPWTCLNEFRPRPKDGLQERAA